MEKIKNWLKPDPNAIIQNIYAAFVIALIGAVSTYVSRDLSGFNPLGLVETMSPAIAFVIYFILIFLVGLISLFALRAMWKLVKRSKSNEKHLEQVDLNRETNERTEELQDIQPLQIETFPEEDRKIIACIKNPNPDNVTNLKVKLESDPLWLDANKEWQQCKISATNLQLIAPDHIDANERNCIVVVELSHPDVIQEPNVKIRFLLRSEIYGFNYFYQTRDNNNSRFYWFAEIKFVIKAFGIIGNKSVSSKPEPVTICFSKYLPRSFQDENGDPGLLKETYPVLTIMESKDKPIRSEVRDQKEDAFPQAGLEITELNDLTRRKISIWICNKNTQKSIIKLDVVLVKLARIPPPEIREYLVEDDNRRFKPDSDMVLPLDRTLVTLAEVGWEDNAILNLPKSKFPLQAFDVQVADGVTVPMAEFEIELDIHGWYNDNLPTQRYKLKSYIRFEKESVRRVQLDDGTPAFTRERSTYLALEGMEYGPE